MLKKLAYRIKRPYHFFKTGLLNGLVSQFRYGFPAKDLKIIAVTGTDGKTTSSTLTYHLLKHAGKKVGLISTVAAYLGDEQLDTGFHVTAPQPSQIQALMRRMVTEGYEYLVLEATSHGIYQYRTWGIKPLIAGLTNIAQEHLDYHLNYENYVDAKVLLFKQADTVILNADDSSFNRVRKRLRGANIIEYSQEKALPASIQRAMKKRFGEEYNRMNTRLAATIMEQLGVNQSVVAEGIESFPGIEGRMQWIDTHRNFSVVIDFAHTPQALQGALVALRQHMKEQKLSGRLIAIFGCASQRDTLKRPIMTAIAVDLADRVVLTAEDPRSEDIWAIIREMKEQLTTGHNKILSIADRQAAITFAIKHAEKGDVIGIFGKGHETTMCYGIEELPWSDRAAVAEALK